jgi:hypothetical protein
MQHPTHGLRESWVGPVGLLSVSWPSGLMSPRLPEHYVRRCLTMEDNNKQQF